MFSKSSLPNCAKKLSSFSLQASATASYTSRESGIILLQYQHTKARNCRNHMGKSFSFPIISDCIVRQKTFDHSNNLFFGQQLWNRTMLHAFYTNLSTACKFFGLDSRFKSYFKISFRVNYTKMLSNHSYQ